MKKKLYINILKNQIVIKTTIKSQIKIKCVEEIDLSHNDLDDTYIHVIIEFILTPGVKKINISHNKITPSVLKPLINCLKNVKNLEFFDISYNPFNTDPACCILLCQAIKGCEKLNHLGVNDHSRESALRLVSTRPTITSLNLDDSRYRRKVWVKTQRCHLVVYTDDSHYRGITSPGCLDNIPVYPAN